METILDTANNKSLVDFDIKLQIINHILEILLIFGTF